MVLNRLLLVATLVACASTVRAESALGKIEIAVAGGTPEARQHFERGLLATHSFWYDEAVAQMEAATQAHRELRREKSSHADMPRAAVGTWVSGNDARYVRGQERTAARWRPRSRAVAGYGAGAAPRRD